MRERARDRTGQEKLLPVVLFLLLLELILSTVSIFACAICNDKFDATVTAEIRQTPTCELANCVMREYRL